ncbi:MAG: hypothetical protein H0T46_12550 [Deltaproteobacteria bacterium]|nr:hypothetical protein [Deltaproteobacteria bacterium]
MQARTRTQLTIWWLAVLACIVLPMVIAQATKFAPIATITSIAWFVTIPLSIVTFRRVASDQQLQRPGWYRAALVSQLVVATVGTVTAAHTVLKDGAIGLVSIATVQLAVVILTWRAIARPDARRAVASALVSGFVPFIALVVDIALDTHTSAARGGKLVADLWSAFAVLSTMFAWLTACVVCIAAVRTFGERTNLPDARAVEV